MPSRDDDHIIRENTRQTRTEPKRKRREQVELKQTHRSRTRRKRNRVLYHEAVALAEDLGIQLSSPAPLHEVMEQIFRRTHALWTHAATEVDQLDPDAAPGKKDSIWTYKWDNNGNKIVEPSKWVALENALRRELFEQAAIGQKLNLDGMRLHVERTTLELLGKAIKEAVVAANVPEDMQRAIGAELRTRLAAIQASDESNQPQEEQETQEAKAA